MRTFIQNFAFVGTVAGMIIATAGFVRMDLFDTIPGALLLGGICLSVSNGFVLGLYGGLTFLKEKILGTMFAVAMLTMLAYATTREWHEVGPLFRGIMIIIMILYLALTFMIVLKSEQKAA